MESSATGIRRLVWVGTLLSLVAIIIAVAAAWLLYNQTTTLLTENLRQRLLSISITEASALDPAKVEALRTEDDWKKPEWTTIVSTMKHAKTANKDIVFMYLFRRTAADASKMEFVADAESINPFANTDNDPSGAVIPASSCPKCVDADGDGKIDPTGGDKLQWPGQPFPEIADIPEAQKAYDGPITVAEPYQDTYGPVYTGFAPIVNASGTVVAILGTDIRTGDFFTITQQTLVPFIAFIVFLVLTILVLTGILIFLWRKRTEVLIRFDEQKNQFLSIASHDLRAPLTVIRNFMSLLLDGTYGKLPQPAEDGARQVFDRATEMAKSVDDYLNVSRIEQGRMKYDFVDTDLAKIVGDTAAIFKTTAEQKGLSFTFTNKATGPVMVKADVGKLQEVFNNLIDNSIKYTPKGSISVTLDKAGNMARVTIADTGLGMSPDTIKNKLFKLFSTAKDSKKVNNSSTGVGLYITKAIIEGHKGTVVATSPGEGKGSTFVVELPLGTS